jgi:hypothetical protein
MPPFAPSESSSRNASTLVFAYAATVFLSAFLLFQVQPLLSKFILPWFGGTPAVWTSAMLFFQMVLFFGYLYAHLTSTFLSHKGRFWVHLLVLGIALISVAANRLVPPNSLRPTGVANESPLLQVLLLLGATVGLPYFALSSTGPLLQKWFSDSFAGASPYRLFALSNFGSLLALLSYPFFFEANWGIVAQASMWSAGFVGFVACCTVCAWYTYARSNEPVAAQPIATKQKTDTANETDAPPSAWNIFTWIALPTLACILFLAVTNEVCQNVATVPLLWIVPLALYLVSFIVAFDHPRWYVRSIYTMTTLVLLIWVANYDNVIDSIGTIVNQLLGRTEENELLLDKMWWLQAAVYFGAMFGMAVICHGELAQSKPAPRYLTWFYLTLSMGGAVGGLLVNLGAPYVFKTFFEFPLCLIACSLLCIGLLFTRWRREFNLPFTDLAFIGSWIILAGCGNLILEMIANPQRTDRRTLHESRNFYGIVSVQQRNIGDPEENFTFYSGHIQHGKQFADPKKRHIPLTYYGEGSGCQKSILYAQSQSPECHIGVIGLGTGTIATYARPADKVRFYEINPIVMEIAQNKEWFHYLSDCQGKLELVLGDARLQLESELRNEQNQQFDVLCLDAFSGDAIPTHLLTDEAFGIYTQHLKPNGILTLHITNSFLDLYPVVKQLAEKHGYQYRRIYKTGGEGLLYRNYYMLLSKNADFISQTADEIGELPDYLSRPREVPLWTDEYTNLTRLLR